jgi:hypothetical protein
MMRMSALCLGLVLVLAGCSTTPDEPDPTWRQTEVNAPSDRVLWKVALLAAKQGGFPLMGGLDPASGVIQTGWRTELQPHRGDGNRQRAEIRMEPRGKSVWLVKARVQRQLNMALASPLDPSRAEWEWAPDNPVKAEVLLRHIVSLFDPDDMTEEAGDESPVPSKRR